MIPRDTAQGVVITDLASWMVEFTDTAGTAVVTYDSTTDDTGGITVIRGTLDGLGLLSQASIDMVIPPNFTPFQYGVRLTLRDGTDEYRAFEGYIRNISTTETTNGQPSIYTIDIGGLHELISKKFWYGFADQFPPTMTRLGSTASENLLGVSVPEIGAFLNPWDPGYKKVNKTVKVGEVMEKALEEFPDATYGVDAERRSVLGRPQDGRPVVLDAANVIGLKPTQYEIPPYVTEMRSDSGGGWGGYVLYRTSPPVSDFVPEVAAESNQAVNETITSYGGPHYRAARVTPDPHYIVKVDATFDDVGHLNYYPEAEVRDGWDGEDFHDIGLPGTEIFDIDLFLLPYTFNSTAKSDMLYVIADPQLWYNQSSLYPDSNSNYEPMSAAFQADMKILHLPHRYCGSYVDVNATYRVTVDAVMWISDSPTYDLDAVGKPGTPIYETIASRTTTTGGGGSGGGTPVTQYFNQVNGIEGVQSIGPIYPWNSAHTIAVEKVDRWHIDVNYSQSQQPVSLTFAIDQKWFREDQVPILNTQGWGDRFYYHIAFSYAVTMGDQSNVGVVPAYQDPQHPDFPDAGRAKVDFTLRQPLFSQKVSTAPAWDENSLGLNYPFYTGPNHEGWFKGILLPPIQLVGNYYKSTAEPVVAGVRPGLTSINQYIAGVDFEISPNMVRTQFRTNVLPYRRPNPYTFSRRTY